MLEQQRCVKRTQQSSGERHVRSQQWRHQNNVLSRLREVPFWWLWADSSPLCRKICSYLHGRHLINILNYYYCRFYSDEFSLLKTEDKFSLLFSVFYVELNIFLSAVIDYSFFTIWRYTHCQNVAKIEVLTVLSFLLELYARYEKSSFTSQQNKDVSSVSIFIDVHIIVRQPITNNSYDSFNKYQQIFCAILDFFVSWI